MHTFHYRHISFENCMYWLNNSNSNSLAGIDSVRDDGNKILDSAWNFVASAI